MRVGRQWGGVLLAGLTTAAAAQEAVPTRDQIPDKYKWNLAAIYPDRAAFEADFARDQELIARLAARKAETFPSAEELLAVLQLRDDAYWLTHRLFVYAHQLSDQDTRDNDALGLKDRAMSLYVAYGEAAAWIEPVLLTVPDETIRGWCAPHEPLALYRHYLENVIRQKPHTLSPREEELLAMAGNLAMSPDKAYTVLKEGEMPWPTMRDEQGNEVVLSEARFVKFIRSADRRVRRDAFLGLVAAYGKFQNTYAATLSGAVHGNIYFAKARRFETPLESTLYPDNLPVAVYTNLLQSVERALPAHHRWAALRKRMLELDELHVWDLYQPLVPGVDQNIPYEDAVATVIAALQPLGPEYCGPMERGFHDGWIDVYETQGKRSGGYCSGSYDTHPYILLNYNGTPHERSTIAHEMGHAMHSYLTHAHQPKVYGDYSLFVAEVAAIFNEILLEEHLLGQAGTPAEKLALLNEQIDSLHQTVFRQTMFAEFEYEAHALALRGEALTAERLNGLYLDVFHKQWGPELVRDPEHGPYWARIPHFYMNHYVYRYATSYCAAVALAEGVLAGRPGALDAYLGFLKAGSSDYPLEVLKRAGVDMTTPAPIEATMRRFTRLVDEFERLAGELRTARGG